MIVLIVYCDIIESKAYKGCVSDTAKQMIGHTNKISLYMATSAKSAAPTYAINRNICNQTLLLLCHWLNVTGVPLRLYVLQGKNVYKAGTKDHPDNGKLYRLHDMDRSVARNLGSMFQLNKVEVMTAIVELQNDRTGSNALLGREYEWKKDSIVSIAKECYWHLVYISCNLTTFWIAEPFRWFRI